MAFSFGNSGNAMNAAGGAGGLAQGSDLEVIQTERLGFLSLAGDAKVQLTNKWSPPPAPTANLLSIASRRGLVAAAGPDGVSIATTEAVRKAFGNEKVGDSEVRPFQPQAKLPLPMRISQLAFTADEQYLVLSAETGGGLAVYDVQSLVQGSTQAAFELATNGETLRVLAPNPAPEFAHFCAIVTNNGNLMMANLKERAIISGPNGQNLRTQVSCVSWSTKGKQLVAGLANGNVSQMTPDGTDKAEIPKPPSLGNYHVSSISWLENNIFLVIHNVTNGQEPSVYHLITRTQAQGQPATFQFQKVSDPVEPFGSEKVPHHSVLRLHNFPPSLTDLLIVSSSATESIGLLSRSKTPLTEDVPADRISNVFTTTELADDSKRAQMPMGEDMMETFPIGTALDLSAKEKVYKPIPADELEYSPGPLPGLWALSNEGVLASWWIIYNESIRGGTTYPGLADGQPEGTAAPATSTAQPPAQNSSPFGAPSTSAPAFGGASALGSKPSPWATAGASTTSAPAFGKSSFGTPGAPATGAPAFGASSFGSQPAAPSFGQSSTIGLGMRTSPWATGSTAGSQPAFGQTPFGSSTANAGGKVFGGSTTTPSTSGGFSGFANKGGFGALGGSSSGSTSIFASAKPTNEVSMDTETAFPPPSQKAQTTSSLGSSPFVLGTTFKADPKTANDNEAPGTSGPSLFGGGFGFSLGDTARQPPASESRDEDMDAPTPAAVATTSAAATAAVAAPPTPAEERPQSIFSSTTPTTTPAPQKFGYGITSGPSPAPNPFSQKANPSPSPAPNPFSQKAAPGPSPASNPFSHKAAPGGLSNIFGTPKSTSPFAPQAKSSAQASPQIKVEEEEDKENLANIPQAPLPPESTSKAAYPLGDSSSSSTVSAVSPQAVNKTPSKDVDDAPLPPDFLSQPKKAPEDAPLPPDFLGSKGKQKAVPEDAPLPPDFLTKKLPDATEALPSVEDDDEDEDDLEEGEIDDEEEDDEEEEEDEEEDDEEDDEEERTEAASEGSGVDVAKDLSPSATGLSSHTPGFTPQSSFGGIGGSTFSSFSRPEPSQQQPRPLFGEVSRAAPPLFPKHVPPSPRSPSPVRGAVPPNLFRSETARSVSAPGMASNILGASRKSQSTMAPPPMPKNRTPMPDPNVEQQRRQARKEAEASPVVVDPEDEGIQAILQSEIEPVTVLDEFLAVDSRLESRPGEPVGTAAEALWRDINRMLDRVALNSRSLKAFIKGNEVKAKEDGRHKEDLDNPDDWVLVEGSQLQAILELDLPQELEEGRVKDVEATKDAIQSLARDLARLRAREEDMKKILQTHLDPEQIAAAKAMPLSAEQAAQQNELRRGFARFCKLLSEAEQALTLLRTKMAAVGGAGAGGKLPTVDAVMRTIAKMMTMAEKRSADLDMLESQMRRLRLGSAGPRDSPGPRSREGSPFVGGASSAASPARRSILSPDGQLRHSLASSVTALSSSPGARGTPPRKKMSNYTDEERAVARQRATKRKGALGRLRASVVKNGGPNIMALGEDDF